MNYYIWIYPDGGGAWIPIGWVRATWDQSSKSWTNIQDTLKTIQGGAWWYAWSSDYGARSPRQGRHESNGIIEEYEMALAYLLHSK